MTKKQELHEILNIYIPMRFPNRAQLVRRLEALIEDNK